MEMGKQLDKVVEQLQSIQPDIVFLQEVDYFARRSGRIDQAGELARMLNMNSVWTCEIVIRDSCELSDDMNSTHLGCEGNAILSRFPMTEIGAILLGCQQVIFPGHRPFKTHAEALAVVTIPNHGEVALCSAHLDPHYTGKIGRAKQYTQLVQRLIPYMAKYPSVIAGDFNTVCTGIGRINIPKLSPDISCILGRLGKSEATQFKETAVYETNKMIEMKCGSESCLNDPFDTETDTTFCGMSGLYNAKLDWCLLSNQFKIIKCDIGNQASQHCSDHMWITVHAALSPKDF